MISDASRSLFFPLFSSVAMIIYLVTEALHNIKREARQVPDTSEAVLRMLIMLATTVVISFSVCIAVSTRQVYVLYAEHFLVQKRIQTI